MFQRRDHVHEEAGRGRFLDARVQQRHVQRVERLVQEARRAAGAQVRRVRHAANEDALPRKLCNLGRLLVADVHPQVAVHRRQRRQRIVLRGAAQFQEMVEGGSHPAPQRVLLEGLGIHGIAAGEAVAADEGEVSRVERCARGDDVDGPQVCAVRDGRRRLGHGQSRLQLEDQGLVLVVGERAGEEHVERVERARARGGRHVAKGRGHLRPAGLEILLVVREDGLWQFTGELVQRAFCHDELAEAQRRRGRVVGPELVPEARFHRAALLCHDLHVQNVVGRVHAADVDLDGGRAHRLVCVIKEKGEDVDAALVRAQGRIECKRRQVVGGGELVSHLQHARVVRRHRRFELGHAGGECHRRVRRPARLQSGQSLALHEEPVRRFRVRRLLQLGERLEQFLDDFGSPRQSRVREQSRGGVALRRRLQEVADGRVLVREADELLLDCEERFEERGHRVRRHAAAAVLPTHHQSPQRVQSHVPRVLF
mmetsp:Transcript_28978/g.97740  ORF Transcript_28978/g.97740 Transcript_28978/m.97740 type:complete len:483 (+) Transcript_28978:742-2190(+)